MIGLIGPRSFAAATSAVLLLAATFADASPTYPTLMQQDLGLYRAPECTLCHANDTGGIGTVVTPFGKSLRLFGLVEESPGSLSEAIKTSEAEKWDSDGDGVPDIDELEAGTDPNDGPGGTVIIPEPEHGCAIARTHETSECGASVLLVLVTSALARRRARRSSTPRNSTK